MEIRTILEKLKLYGWLLDYEFEDENTLTIKYGLDSVKETSLVLHIKNNNLKGLKSALLKSTQNLATNMEMCLTDENDFFGYNSQEELDNRIKEELIFLIRLNQETNVYINTYIKEKKKQVYKKLEETWNLGDNTTLGQIKKYYYQLTGGNTLSIGNKVNYLYGYALEKMLTNGEITEELYKEIEKDLKHEFDF